MQRWTIPTGMGACCRVRHCCRAAANSQHLTLHGDLDLLHASHIFDCCTMRIAVRSLGSLENDTHCVLPAVQHSRDGAISQQTVAQSTAVESARMCSWGLQEGGGGHRAFADEGAWVRRACAAARWRTSVALSLASASAWSAADFAAACISCSLRPHAEAAGPRLKSPNPDTAPDISHDTTLRVWRQSTMSSFPSGEIHMPAGSLCQS